MKQGQWIWCNAKKRTNWKTFHLHADKKQACVSEHLCGFPGCTSRRDKRQYGRHQRRTACAPTPPLTSPQAGSALVLADGTIHSAQTKDNTVWREGKQFEIYEVVLIGSPLTIIGWKLIAAGGCLKRYFPLTVHSSLRFKGRYIGERDSEQIFSVLVSKLEYNVVFGRAVLYDNQMHNSHAWLIHLFMYRVYISTLVITCSLSHIFSQQICINGW